MDTKNQVSDEEIIQAIKGMNVIQLAVLTGIDRIRLMRFEYGDEYPTEEEFQKLRVAMGYPARVVETERLPLIAPPQVAMDLDAETLSASDARQMHRENNKLLKKLVEQGQRTNQLLEELVKEVKRKK